MGYRLGTRALSRRNSRLVGHAVLRSVSAPILLDLATRTEMVVHLAVLEGPTVYMVDKVGWHTSFTVPSRIGGRLPAHCTALGKAMHSWSKPATIEAEFVTGLVRRTAHSIGDMGTLYRQLGKVRMNGGIALERGECYPGIGCMSSAVLGPAGPVAAISVVASVNAPLEYTAPMLTVATRNVSDALFRNGDT